MDNISAVNLWCQKHGVEFPTYTYSGSVDNWLCKSSASWLKEEIISSPYAVKKLAKQDCAERIYKSVQTSAVEIIDFDGCIMIDGDQRADCWKWLADSNTKINNAIIKVYTGPTTPVAAEKDDIQHICVNSPSRDAADARMLMDLGFFTCVKKYNQYIIVSSDHILVQAALDTPTVRSAANLKQFKQLFF